MEAYLASENHKDTKKCLEIRKANLIENDTCLSCYGQAKDFRDDISFLDFIYRSGLCQRCQDKS